MLRPRLPVVLVALAVLLAAALAWWRLVPRTPSIEAEVSRLEGVIDVRAGGPAEARATVLHLLDYHFVPPYQLLDPVQRFKVQRFGAEPERAYPAHLDAVESVQKE